LATDRLKIKPQTKRSTEMTTRIELNSVFDQAEELVGTYPSSEGLRNAIHAVIGKRIDVHAEWLNLSPTIMNNVEYLARNYETLRGVHMHTETACRIDCDTPTDAHNGVNGWEGNNDPIYRNLPSTLY
jgi:hypothetical protein